jgi:uncharacterized protein
MKTRFCLFFLLLALATAPLHAAGLGWAVSDADGNRIYLVGTVHAADESFYPLPAAIETAFDDSAVLVMEIDPTALDPREMQSLVREHGMLGNRASLRDLVPEATWDLLVAHGRRNGLAPRQLARLRPWLATTTLVSAGLVAAGIDRAYGMEPHFTARAAERAMPLRALETPTDQVMSLANLSMPAQIAFLENSLVDEDEFAESVRRILDGWRDGDVQGMADLLLATYEDHDELYETLINTRNRTWLPQVVAMLASGEAHFVAVGSLHLVGPDGLVELMEGAGFRVERLQD